MQTKTVNKIPLTKMIISLTRTRRLLNIVIVGFIQLFLTQLAMIAFLQGCGKGSLQTAKNIQLDSLHQVRNEAGEQVTSMNLLVAERKELLKISTGRDSTLKELQRIVKKQSEIISAVVLNTVTNNQGAALTKVVNDSVKSDSCYPVYKTIYKDKWRELSIVAQKDSIRWNIKDFNEFDIVQKYQGNGLFARKVPVIEVTNKNPYTETRELKPFILKQRKQRKGLIFLAGIISGAGTMILLSH